MRKHLHQFWQFCRESRLLGFNSPRRPDHYDQFSEAAPQVENIDQMRDYLSRRGPEEAAQVIAKLKNMGFDLNKPKLEKYIATSEDEFMSLGQGGNFEKLANQRKDSPVEYRFGTSYKHGEKRMVLRAYRRGYGEALEQEREMIQQRRVNRMMSRGATRSAKARRAANSEKLRNDMKEMGSTGVYSSSQFLGEIILNVEETAEQAQERRALQRSLQPTPQERDAAAYEARLAQRRETYRRNPAAFRNWTPASRREFLNLTPDRFTPNGDVNLDPNDLSLSDRRFVSSSRYMDRTGRDTQYRLSQLKKQFAAEDAAEAEAQAQRVAQQNRHDRMDAMWASLGYPGGQEQAFAAREQELKYGKFVREAPDALGNVTLRFANGRLVQLDPAGDVRAKLHPMEAISDVDENHRGDVMRAVAGGLRVNFDSLLDFNKRMAISRVRHGSDRRGVGEVLAVSTRDAQLDGRQRGRREGFVLVREARTPTGEQQTETVFVPESTVSVPAFEQMKEQYKQLGSYYAVLLPSQFTQLFGQYEALGGRNPDQFVRNNTANIVRLRVAMDKYSDLLTKLPSSRRELLDTISTDSQRIVDIISADIKNSPDKADRQEAWSDLMEQLTDGTWWQQGGLADQVTQAVQPRTNQPTFSLRADKAERDRKPDIVLPQPKNPAAKDDARSIVGLSNMIDSTTATDLDTTTTKLQEVAIGLQQRINDFSDKSFMYKMSNHDDLKQLLVKFRSAMDPLPVNDRPDLTTLNQQVTALEAQLKEGIESVTPAQEFAYRILTAITQIFGGMPKLQQQYLDEPERTVDLANFSLDALQAEQLPVEQVSDVLSKLGTLPAAVQQSEAWQTAYNTLIAKQDRITSVREGWAKNNTPPQQFVRGVELAGKGDLLAVTVSDKTAAENLLEGMAAGTSPRPPVDTPDGMVVYIPVNNPENLTDAKIAVLMTDIHKLALSADMGKRASER